jgi:hypothetical protein
VTATSHVLALLTAIGAAGCIASNVVAPEQRFVVADTAELAFAPATPGALQGFYGSVDIRGDAATALRRIYYLFAADGTYTGAALADVGEHAQFQTLSGTWTLDERGLALDGGEPVPCAVAGEHVRLTAPNGVVVLRREVLQ